MGDQSMTMSGKYKFLEEELMEMELDNPGAKADPEQPKTISQKVKIKIDKDNLTTTDETRWKRPSA